ncbi:MAG: ACT domain-containing protein [Pseudomonadota bacterium]
MSKVLISILGQDQPGIIANVAGLIFSRKGNIENVSQTLLQSMFGALLIVSVPDNETPQALQEALQVTCAALNLFVHVEPYIAPAPNIKPDVQPYIVTAIGPDQPGLVWEIATQLARHDVNITNMQAIFKGTTKPLDNLMIFEVDVPRHTVMNDLRASLREISERLALDIKVQHRKIFESVSRIQN